VCTLKQKAIALSSAEAELYALSVGVSEALHVQALLCELAAIPLGQVELCANTDNNSTRSLAHRSGQGRCKHLSTHSLWIQSKAKTGEVRVLRVNTEANPSDIATKVVGADTLSRLRKRGGV